MGEKWFSCESVCFELDLMGSFIIYCVVSLQKMPLADCCSLLESRLMVLLLDINTWLV